MKKSEFIEKLKEALEIDTGEEVTEETNLKDFEGYDSVGVLGIIAMVDASFGKQLSASDIQKVTTVGSLIKIIGKEHVE